MINATQSSSGLRLAVIGVGPCGLTIFERICANLAEVSPAGPVHIFLIDPECVGTGTFWRTGQSSHLLINTTASRVTVFTDPSVHMEDPVSPGPSLYQWATYLNNVDSLGVQSDQLLAEARDMASDTYPTRTFYGHYLRWAFEHIRNRSHERIDIIEVHGSAVDVRDDTSGLQTIELDTGDELAEIDAVVLTQGRLPGRSGGDAISPAVTTVVGTGALQYIRAGNAADADLSQVTAQTPVIVRGLGLTFFDYMTLLTSGRGGSFAETNGMLTYLPSGREPVVYAGSRRGIPYHALCANPKNSIGDTARLVLTQERIDELRARASQTGDVNFRHDVWPLIAKEVETAYYSVLLADRISPRELRRFRGLFIAAPIRSTEEADVLTRFNIEGHLRWDWLRNLDPSHGIPFSDSASFNQWLLGHLNKDVRNARLGSARSAVTAALVALQEVRDDVLQAVDHGGITASSYREDFNNWYAPMNAFLTLGPPVHRIEEMVALIRAGILHLVGPHLQVDADAAEGCFTAHSPVVGNSTVHARTLIDARLCEPPVGRSSDKLMQNLLRRGEVRPRTLPDPTGSPYDTGCIEVTGLTHTLIDHCGAAHPRRFALGSTTADAGPQPRISSTAFSAADALARAMLSHDRRQVQSPA